MLLGSGWSAVFLSPTEGVLWHGGIQPGFGEFLCVLVCRCTQAQECDGWGEAETVRRESVC